MTVKSNNTPSVATFNTVNPREVGRSQLGRHIRALSRSFFKIEPRTVEAGLKYLSVLAKQVNYIDERTLSANGTWENLLPEPEKLVALAQLVENGNADEQIKLLASRPDMALLLTFIDLLQHSNTQFNQFVARHLDHFYRDVLRFEPLPASADSAHVVVSLNSVDALTLPAGTQFDGGKDTQGIPLVYSTDEVVTINKATVDYVASVNKIKSSEKVSLNHQILLDSEQGIVLEQSEPTFGQGLEDQIPSSVEMGFKIASQDLFLSGGTRIISLDFGAQAKPSGWKGWFDFYISTSDGLRGIAVDKSNDIAQKLQFTFSSLFPAITALEQSPIASDKALPFVALVLKNEYYQKLYGDGSSVFEDFNSFTVTQVSLTTQVNGLGDVIANNGEADLDTAKPFEPFGLAPRLASKIHFIHPELIVKNITHASVEFAWLDRPDSFDNYYRAYSYYYSEQHNLGDRYFDKNALCVGGKSCEEGTLSIEELFSTNCNCLTWPDSAVIISRSDEASEAQTRLELFYNEGDDKLPEVQNNIAINTLTFVHNDDNSLRDVQALPLDEPTASKWPKYYTLELSEQDFAHKDYTKVIELFAYKNANSNNPVLVNTPYTPTLDSLTLNYQSVSITSATEMLGNPIFVEYIAPVGRPTKEFKQNDSLSLLPKMEEFGYLYMALSEVSTPGQVRMYFQVDLVEGYNMGNNPEFVWEYFNEGTWHRFKREESQGQVGEGRILRDSTYDLLDSGLVVFYLPKLTQSGSFNHDGKLWLRARLNQNRTEASSDNNTYPVYSKLKGVFTQGIKVSLTSQGNDASHFEQPLASESISKMLLPNSKVDTILQPFASFDSKVAETRAQYDRRISERLHHRQRLLSGWDYEHFVLQTFPQLHSVRPVVNSSALSLVVVPLNHDVSVLQPKVPRYLKRQIRERVNALSVPNLTVEVDDPHYVEVQLELIVKIDSLYDIQSTVIELNNMVVETLTPWNKLDKPLESTIYLASIAQVLETHPAVDMIQVIRAIKKGQTEKQYSVINADNPSEILVPARNHKIALANTLGDVFEGIGKWEIELDFVVQ